MKYISMIIFLFFALLSFVYGIDVMNLNSGSSFYLIWFVIGLFLLLMAFLLYKDLFKKISKILIVIFISLLSVGLLLFTYVEVLIFKGINSKPPKDLDYIIVLGAQVRKDGPASVLQYRLDAAIDYLNDNPNTFVIVSGGQGRNEPFSEAKGMKEYLLKKGIMEDRILVEDESQNTITNIINSIKLYDIENKKVGIVTNNFHLYRGMAIARKQGIKNVYGIKAYSNPHYLPHNALREFFGILKDTIFGNM